VSLLTVRELLSEDERPPTVAAMGKRRAKPDVQEQFGTAVKFRREELKLTQEGLAEKAKIHRTYLSDVERGTRNLSLVNIEKTGRGAVAEHVEAVRTG
jgi:ribosome-binding protein aMBF1 (putative translation factor)